MIFIHKNKKNCNCKTVRHTLNWTSAAIERWNSEFLGSDCSVTSIYIGNFKADMILYLPWSISSLSLLQKLQFIWQRKWWFLTIKLKDWIKIKIYLVNWFYFITFFFPIYAVRCFLQHFQTLTDAQLQCFLYLCRYICDSKRLQIIQPNVRIVTYKYVNTCMIISCLCIIFV